MTKNKRKLISAIAMLATSIAMLATSTFAWFTMNKEVEVTNLNVKVKTSSNLLISKTNTSDETFVDGLSEEGYALLEPVSTIDGVNYFYTLDGAADGHKIHGPDADNPYVKYNETATLTNEDTYADKTKYDVSFNNAYGISTANPATLDKYLTAYGYIDYSFYIKATSVAANQQIVMNKCNLLYNDEVVDEKAWRVALFVQEVAAATEVSTVGDLVTIVGLDGMEYQETDKGVNGTTTIDTVDNLSENAIVDDSISANETKYYKVVIRLWLEGEDTTCTTEVFGTKTEEYKLELGFSIDSEDTPINKISSEI